MPELPEVEVVRLTLEPHIVGKTVQHLEALHPKPVSYTPEILDALTGRTIASINRRGKLLYISFTEPNMHVAIHLKMTGQLIYQDAAQMEGGGHTLSKTDHQLPHRHTRVQLNFTNGSSLFFNDLRLFGYWKLVNDVQLAAILNTYGIEPGMDNFTKDAFFAALKGRKTNIKALLLNQKLISGLGNIYVDEACFYAKVKPTRRVNSLKKSEKELLYEGSKHVILDSIKHGGTTFYSFADGEGKAGNYLTQLHVFAKEGTPCSRCDTEIKKIKHAGRGTHFCPGCQV